MTKMYKSRRKEYSQISKLIQEYYDQNKEDTKKEEIKKEVSKKVEEKRLEYVTNDYKVQDILFGIHFLILSKHVENAEAEKLRFIAAQLGIKHKIDPLKIS